MKLLFVLVLCLLLVGCNFMGLTHGPGERVIFLDGSERLVPIDPVRFNGAFNYKVVTTNQDVPDATPVSFTWRGGTIRPLAPVNVRGHRDSEGNLLIEWTRRSRIGPGLRPGSDVPLGEERERYEIDILDGSNNVLRTLKVDLSQGVPAILVPASTDPSFITGNDMVGDPTSVTAPGAYALQKLDRAGSFVEARLTTPADGSVLFGLLESAYAPQWITSGLADLYIYRSTLVFTTALTPPGLTVLENESGDAPPSTQKFTSGTLGVTAVRVRIEIGDSGAKYYWDYTGDGSVPFYVSDIPVSLPAVGVFNIIGTNGAIDDVFIGQRVTPSTILSTDDQIQLFGSPQTTVGSIGVDLYQMSSIVGRGARARAHL